jgi:hypothetical protein
MNPAAIRRGSGAALDCNARSTGRETGDLDGLYHLSAIFKHFHVVDFGSKISGKQMRLIFTWIARSNPVSPDVAHLWQQCGSGLACVLFLKGSLQSHCSLPSTKNLSNKYSIYFELPANAFLTQISTRRRWFQRRELSELHTKHEISVCGVDIDGPLSCGPAEAILDLFGLSQIFIGRPHRAHTVPVNRRPRMSFRPQLPALFILRTIAPT